MKLFILNESLLNVLRSEKKKKMRKNWEKKDESVYKKANKEIHNYILLKFKRKNREDFV